LEDDEMMVNLYATVGTNRLDEARVFYNALMGQVGLPPMMEHPNGGQVYGEQGGPFAFTVLAPYDGRAATVGNGAMVAFGFDSRAEVDAFHARALALGGTDEGAPGERAPTFYFAYVRDLDGNKLCAYCLG
jgi:catechol 2,3-dioxygenase-like lactoylglutathione lyase family enzyme